ncbi:MAG: tRNA uridine-5-carboxymethylaminomethyl(34) synthesis enzyme MnmG [Verrucomicrobia bacterium GWF2_51_19]|nr:MAG: tRNA uridine-5-carboxymethylaminomethyl(34) synthesis enzyme MnmG [Verrucomicrobia bacterium GWF2_51_19]
MLSRSSYDVIVCGAGHAGCEAALAAARMGARTLLLTGNLDTIAQMSCNPAIGGQAKGHIVREVDALGGEMAVNTDFTAIQFRLLNRSKGLAVQAPRAQCDKKAYQFRMKQTLEMQPNLHVFQAEVTGLILRDGAVAGVETNLGCAFKGKTVILTTGTFLKGIMFVGDATVEGGRMGDFAAKRLSKSLLDSGIQLERLKTGTPARILGRSIDFSVCEEQKSDSEPTLFAFYDTREEMFHVEQLGENRVGWGPNTRSTSCWMTYTNDQTEAVIQANLRRSAMYGGKIEGVGPRYCPSIEDKIVRFSDKERHRLFLEPEGIHTDEWYINGLSTSMPMEVQEAIIRTIPGLEQAIITRPAYAVEYDYAPPTQLQPSLESKSIGGLFCAGQINGTSGYEEAACQGLVAGVNAAAKCLGLSELVIGREEAYTGVLIDDLVTKGTQEPYRMFTSRAEYRLLLNHNSAELRLIDKAAQYNLLPEARVTAIRQKKAAIEHWVSRFEGTGLDARGTLADALRRNLQVELPYAFQALSGAIREEVLYRVLYRGYLEKDFAHIAKMKAIDAVRIPSDFNYETLKGLRNESLQKLKKIRPQTLGQASRISGINPADVSVLLVYLRK